jgi:glycosyltransferase involved in cell wall biosynthesis/SAM-dependent methyltransferase
MNVVFVNYYDFSSNSAVHIFNLANRLADHGVESVVCVPSSTETVHALGKALFRYLSFAEAQVADVHFSDGHGPDVVHAWTPRENVRQMTEELARRHNAAVVVHLEDNEDVITSDYLGVDVSDLDRLDASALESLPATLTHPRRYREFLRGATGVTAVVEPLTALAPNGVSVEVISPAFEEQLFTPRPADTILKEELRIPSDSFVLVYAGNTHPSNADEVRSLYLAVELLNRRGLSVKLVRLGTDYVDFLGGDLDALRAHEVRVPFQLRCELPRYFALADVLVQPGRPSQFNDFRLPSKLPEFFAMGRPVVLPASNVGLEVVDRTNAVVLSEGHAIEIAHKVEGLLRDQNLRERIGEAGRRFAEERFSWARSSQRLADFYGRVAPCERRRPPARHTEAVWGRYASLEIPRVGYATVRDYADSCDHLPSLATLSGDLKDVQRPWTVKAILSTVQPQSRLLEIGAGEPHVASLLKDFGYDAWVIDPYDGRDGGPSDFGAIRDTYPGVRFVQGLFPDALDDALVGTFDCIYSISVLEHIPFDRVVELCSAMERFLRPGGVLIHAIDHVHLGRGDEAHRSQLGLITRTLGVQDDRLEATLARLDADPETYFLSAESHNRWRGATPYDDFPMRRCISIELCLRSDEPRQ